MTRNGFQIPKYFRTGKKLGEICIALVGSYLVGAVVTTEKLEEI